MGLALGYGLLIAAVRCLGGCPCGSVPREESCASPGPRHLPPQCWRQDACACLSALALASVLPITGPVSRLMALVERYRAVKTRRDWQPDVAALSLGQRF